MKQTKIFTRRPLIALGTVLTLAACQTTTVSKAPVAPDATTVIENSEQTTINNNQSRTVLVTQPPQPKTLSVIKVVDGSGCPERDPATYGVFLRSESSDRALLCYYN